MPLLVVGRILAESRQHNSPAQVLTEFSGELLFHDGASAGFFCSFLAQNQQWGNISGQHGYLRVEDFVVPFAGDEIAFEIHNHEFLKSGCDFKMEPRVSRFTIAEHSHGHASAQETNLFRDFTSQVRSGQLNHDWPEFALKTQAVLEACLDSARAQEPLTLRDEAWQAPL